MRTTSFLSPMGGVMLVLLLCAISSVNSYSKYGRGCGDIGCLPNEVCVQSHDSCGFGQRDGKECGNYPTCKKSGAASSNSGGVKPSDNSNENITDMEVVTAFEYQTKPADINEEHLPVANPRQSTQSNTRQMYQGPPNSFASTSAAGSYPGGVPIPQTAPASYSPATYQQPMPIGVYPGASSSAGLSQVYPAPLYPPYPLPSYQTPIYGSVPNQGTAPYPVYILDPCFGGIQYPPPISITYPSAQVPPCRLQPQRSYIPPIIPQPAPTYPVFTPPVQQQPCFNIVGCMNILNSNTIPYQGQQPTPAIPTRNAYPNNDDKFNGFVLSQDNDGGLLHRVARSIHSGLGFDGEWDKKNVADESRNNKGSGKGIGQGTASDSDPAKENTLSDVSKPKKKKSNSGMVHLARELMDKFIRMNKNDEDKAPAINPNKVDVIILSKKTPQQEGIDGSSQKVYRVERAVSENGQKEFEPMAMSEDVTVHLQGYGPPPPRYGPGYGQGYGQSQGNGQGQGPNRQGTGQRQQGMQWQQQRGPRMQGGPNGRAGQGPGQGQRQGQGRGRGGYNQGPNGWPNQNGRGGGGQNQNGRGNGQNGRMGGGGGGAGGGRGQGQGQGQNRVRMRQQGQGRGGAGNNQGTSSTTTSPNDTQYQDQDQYQDYVTSDSYDEGTDGEVQSLRRFARAIDDHLANDNLEELQITNKLLHRPSRSLFDNFKPKKNQEEIPAPPARQGKAEKLAADGKVGSLHRVARGLFDRFNRRGNRNDTAASPVAAGTQTKTVPAPRPQQTSAIQASTQKPAVNSKTKSLHRVARGLFDRFNRRGNRNNTAASPVAAGKQTNTVPVARPQQTSAMQASTQKPAVNSKTKSLHRVARGLFDRFNRRGNRNNTAASSVAAGTQTKTVPAPSAQQTSARQASTQKPAVNSKTKRLNRVARGLFDRFNRRGNRNGTTASPVTAGTQTNTVAAARPQQTSARQASTQKPAVNSKTKRLNRVARGLFDRFNRRGNRNGTTASPVTAGTQTNTVAASRPQQTSARQASTQKPAVNSKTKRLNRVARGLFDRFNRRGNRNGTTASPFTAGTQTNTVAAARPQQTSARQASTQKPAVNSKTKRLNRVARGLFDRFNRRGNRNGTTASPFTAGTQTNTVAAARPQQTSARQGSVQKTGANGKIGTLNRVARGLFDKFNRKERNNDAVASPATTSQQTNTVPLARTQQNGPRQGSAQKTVAIGNVKSLKRVARSIASQNDDAGFQMKTKSEQVSQQRGNPNGQRGQGQNRQGQGQNRQGQGQNRQGQGQNRQGQGQSRQAPPQNRQRQSGQSQNTQPSAKNSRSSTNGRVGYSQRSPDGRAGVYGSSSGSFQSRSGSQISRLPPTRSSDRNSDEWNPDSRYGDCDRGFDRVSGYDSNYNRYDQRRGPAGGEWRRTDSQSQYIPSLSGGPPPQQPQPSSSNTYQSSYTGSQTDYQPQWGSAPSSQQGGYQTDYQTSSYAYYPASGSTQNGYYTQSGAGSQASSGGYTFVQYPNGTSVHYAVAMEPVTSTTTTTTTTTAPAAATVALTTTTPKK